MHQPVMIGPTADPIEPQFKHPKFAVAALRVQCFEQENARGLLLQYRARKQLIRHLGQKSKIVLAQNLAPASSNGPPQRRRIPPA